MEARKAWDRQPGENGRAYEAFKIYLRRGWEGRALEDGPAVRRIAGIQELVTPQVAYTTIGYWSSKYKWKDRAGAYDLAQLSSFDDETARLLSQMRRKTIRRRLALQDKAHAVIHLLIARVEEMLKFGIFEDTEETILADDGKEMLVIHRMPVGKWNHGMIPGLIDSLVRLKEVAVSDPSTPIEEILADIDFSKLSNESLYHLAQSSGNVAQIIKSALAGLGPGPVEGEGADRDT